MRETYCALGWTGLNITPRSASVCCWSSERIPYSQVNQSNAIESPILFVTRDKMLKNELVAGCSQCYHNEDIGIWSRRQHANERIGRVEEVKLRTLDISFDNICNLKCRGCISAASHLWRDDEEAIYGRTFFDKKYDKSNLWESIDYSGLDKIIVSGGEPFLSPNAEAFFAKLDNIENIDLTVSTNGTVLPGPAFYNALLNCKSLDLSISLEGYGSVTEYFRSLSNFDTVIANLRELEKLIDLRKTKTLIQITTVVSIYNATKLSDLGDFLKKEFPRVAWLTKVLSWPPQLSLSNMPEDLKDIMRPVIESYGPSQQHILNHLNMPGDNLFEHFLNFHNKLDELRNENLRNCNELLADYVDAYQTQNPVRVDSKEFLNTQMLNLLSNLG